MYSYVAWLANKLFENKNVKVLIGLASHLQFSENDGEQFKYTKTLLRHVNMKV